MYPSLQTNLSIQRGIGERGNKTIASPSCFTNEASEARTLFSLSPCLRNQTSSFGLVGRLIASSSSDERRSSISSNVSRLRLLSSIFASIFSISSLVFILVVPFMGNRKISLRSIRPLRQRIKRFEQRDDRLLRIVRTFADVVYFICCAHGFRLCFWQTENVICTAIA